MSKRLELSGGLGGNEKPPGKKIWRNMPVLYMHMQRKKKKRRSNYEEDGDKQKKQDF